MKKIVILENDQIWGDNNLLPYIIKDFCEIYKDSIIEVWDRFSIDVMQDSKGSMDRFKNYVNDGFQFLTYPSFCTYDSMFDGWAIFLHNLAEYGVSITVNVIFGTDGKDLLALARERHNEVYGSMKHVKEKIESAISKHNIKYLSYENASISTHLHDETDALSVFIPLTIELFLSKMFKRKDKFKVIATGEILEVDYVYFSRDHNHCTVSSFDENENEREFKFEEVEKIN